MALNRYKGGIKKQMNANELKENLPSVRNFEDKPNQFLIRLDEGVLFQSYNSPIAFERTSDGHIFIFKDWDYSKTTGKYRNLFLGETKDWTLKKLLSGEYTAVGFTISK